jgi:hypothetical protein
MFTEPLPGNKRLLGLHYSGFQASCHSIKCFFNTTFRVLKIFVPNFQERKSYRAGSLGPVRFNQLLANYRRKLSIDIATSEQNQTLSPLT